MNLNPPTPDEVRDFMEGLKVTDEAPETLLPPTDAPVSVVRSIRFPYELDQRINDAVESQDGPWKSRTELVVQMVEAGLNALANDQLISKAQAVQLLLGIHPIDPSHAA